MIKALTSFERLCLHTMTTKPLTLNEAIHAYEAAGISGITVWRQHLDADAAARLRDSSLKVVSLCRGGFFPAETIEERRERVDDNLRAIEEAHEIGAPLLVLVPGAVPGMLLETGREQIQWGIEQILPAAESAGVRLAVEPLHPMYADDRSAISTLRQANDVVRRIDHEKLGVAIDVYHVWWDDTLPEELVRAGERIFAFHVCDWRTPTRHMLNDRELMGRGCIPIRKIREWVEASGFSGPIEVEIFSDVYWAEDQVAYIEAIKRAYLEHV